MKDHHKNLDPESIEILWLDCCESTCHEMEARHLKSALEYCEEALSLSKSFTDNDPRIAATLNNLAVVYRLRQDFDQASKHYQLAKKQWNSACEWVNSMDIASRAASSVFHLRMENRHKKKYNEPLIQEYQKNLLAGYAATLNNQAELMHSTDNQQQARAQYALAQEKRLQANLSPDPDSRIINANLHASLKDPDSLTPTDKPDDSRYQRFHDTKFIELARRNSWIIDKPPVFTDEGRLMAALYLTYILDATSIA